MALAEGKTDWSKVESDWYNALFEEDCVRVSNLLKDHPSLLQVGWKSDLREVEGRRGNFWKEVTKSKWEGRTALHVAARRGCADLVKQVIQICPEGKLISDPVMRTVKQRFGHHEEDIHISSKNKEATMVSPKHPDVVQIEGADRSDRKIISGSSGSQQDALVASEDDRRGADGTKETTSISGRSQPHTIVAAVEGDLRDAEADEGPGTKDRNADKGVDRSVRKTIAGSSGFHQDAIVAPEDDGRGADGKDTIYVSSHSEPDAVVAALEGDLREAEADEGPGTSSADTLINKKRSDMIAELTAALWKSEVEANREANKKTGRNAFKHWKSFVKDRKADDTRERKLEFSFKDLLAVKDGEYKLEAIAIALLNGNLDVLSLLMESDGSVRYKSDLRAQSRVQRDQLRTTTKEFMKSILANPVTRKKYGSIFDTYSKHRDFNFLPQEEYLFHFLFSSCFGSMHGGDSAMKAELLRELLWKMVVRNSSSEEEPRDFSSEEDTWDSSSQDDTRNSSQENTLWKFLLTLHDGQGRTPLHVAVDEGTVRYHVKLFSYYEYVDGAIRCAMEACDASGRTSTHRAIALGAIGALGELDALNYLSRNKRRRTSHLILEVKKFQLQKNVLSSIPLRKKFVSSTDETGWQLSAGGWLDWISWRNGFRATRVMDDNIFLLDPPFHSAIIHGREKIVSLVALNFEFEYSKLPVQEDLVSFRYFYGPGVPCKLSALELATLVGELGIVKRLLGWLEMMSEEQQSDPLRPIRETKGSTQFWRIHRPSLSIFFAARHGSYELLKETIENSHFACNPFAEDADGNTALHYAMKMGSIDVFETHLLDYVNCEHIQENDPRDTNTRVSKENRNSISERQGCINLLLQKGCDIFKPNHKGEIPYPSGDLSANATFLSWWYDKQAKEFGEIQNTMSFAVNAISVTAALVATTSYVGPLQPPLGYDGDDQMQAKNIWVRAFIVCDTLSFYLAIASITFSLIPSLPMPQQAMMEELRRKRVMVTLATAILFPSILCILVAFASSSIAGTIAGGPSTTGASLTIITTSIGGLVCSIGFALFSIRLLKSIFPRNSFLTKVYNATSI